jgi:predicted transcriptional regulator
MKKDLDVGSILLTRQELQIMKVVWEEGAATVREVRDAFSQRKAAAYTTILTFMRILEGKGALAHTKSGRVFIYRPLLTHQQATRNHVHDLIERFFDGCPDRLIADVLKNEVMAPEQLGNAKNLLDSWQANEVA